MQAAVRETPVLDLIGNTPMLPLRFPERGLTVYVKAEYLNPSGSVKDRLARYLIEDAERRGLLRHDSIIVECSSGNTGIALAMVGAVKGYAVRILMSASASTERRHLLHQFGAEVVLFEPMSGSHSFTYEGETSTTDLPVDVANRS